MSYPFTFDPKRQIYSINIAWTVSAVGSEGAERLVTECVEGGNGKAVFGPMPETMVEPFVEERKAWFDEMARPRHLNLCGER